MLIALARMADSFAAVVFLLHGASGRHSLQAEKHVPRVVCDKVGHLQRLRRLHIFVKDTSTPQENIPVLIRDVSFLSLDRRADQEGIHDLVRFEQTDADLLIKLHRDCILELLVQSLGVWHWHYIPNGFVEKLFDVLK